MTTVSIASVKGAPGVTTLACLVAAAWPEGRRVVVVEGDPGGGDLAARFQLSAQRGWPSFVAASRRQSGKAVIAEHTQQLPGGVQVMVGTRCSPRDDDRRSVTSLMEGARSAAGGPWDVIADIGRLLPGERSVESWLEESTAVALVLRRDAPSVLRARERAPALRRRCPGAIGLVVVGSGPFRKREIEQFTELPVLVEVPDDREAARIAGGLPGRASRLSRSSFVRSARRLASRLSADPADRTSPSSQPSPSWQPASPHSTEGSATGFGPVADAPVSQVPPREEAAGRSVGQPGGRPDAEARSSRRKVEAGLGKVLR